MNRRTKRTLLQLTLGMLAPLGMPGADTPVFDMRLMLAMRPPVEERQVVVEAEKPARPMGLAGDPAPRGTILGGVWMLLSP